jgi:hypothetical protein
MWVITAGYIPSQPDIRVIVHVLAHAIKGCQASVIRTTSEFTQKSFEVVCFKPGSEVYYSIHANGVSHTSGFSSYVNAMNKLKGE